MADLAEVRRWATALIAQHLDPTLWSFDFDRARTRAGACDYARHRITLSRLIAERSGDDEVRQTLLHEIGHALAGAQAHHGPEWRRIAEDLGYTGGRVHAGP